MLNNVYLKTKTGKKGKGKKMELLIYAVVIILSFSLVIYHYKEHPEEALSNKLFWSCLLMIPFIGWLLYLCLHTVEVEENFHPLE